MPEETTPNQSTEEVSNANESEESTEDDGEDIIESIEEVFPFEWLFGRPRSKR